jgi:hypothetical protein
VSTKPPQPPPAGYVPKMPISPPPPPSRGQRRPASVETTPAEEPNPERSGGHSGWGCVLVLLALTLFWWGVLCGIAAWRQGGGGP